MNPYDKKIENMEKLRDLYALFEDKGLELTTCDSMIIVKIKNLEELSKVRQILRNVLPQGWTDKQRSVWNSWGDTIMVSWENPINRLIEIWFQTTVEDFPESLKKDSCKFEQQPQDAQWTLVCNGAGD